MSTTAFEAHPIADLFPMLSEQELSDLADDIRENGLLEAIVLHEGKILDGRNRYAACEMADVPIRIKEWRGEGGSPLRYVLSHNLHRRHLTTSQRAAIAAEILPMFQEEARARMLSGHPSVKRSQGTGKASHEAAEVMNVSPASVERAKRVKEGAPEEFEMVKAGDKTVTAALRDSGLADVNRAHTRKASDPLIQTPRDQTRAEAHKRRLETALSNVSGTCRGIQDIDIDLALAAMPAEEAATWAAIAGECARALRALRKDLNRS